MRYMWVVLASLVLAGCSSTQNVEDAAPEAVADATDVLALLNATLASGLGMVFEESVVDAAVSYAADLYEPTMEVSSDGTIFVTGHTILVDTTGAPVYGSWDDGQTWSQLPFTRDLTMPGDVHGATPPPSDEIFLVAGDDGWLYGVDITLATFPVNAWSQDGRFHAYHNPNAYDEHQVVLQADECSAAPAKDRPWAAYASGTLLMVSNPAAGPAQVGVLPVPAGPLGMVTQLPDEVRLPGGTTVPVPVVGGDPVPYGLGAVTGGGHWNLCAGIGYHTADNSIPGIPDMRADGLFAVPQRGGGGLYLITGNKMDIHQLDVVQLFPHSTGGEITSVYGQAAFDKNGTLFVGITENTAPDENGTRTGQIHLAVSTDGAKTFEDRIFVTGKGPVRHMYMDGNRFGPGSLIVWAVDGNTTRTNSNGDEVTAAWDWYAAHIQVADGLPVLENVSLIIDEGKAPSAHVTGAAVGPDGRSYTAMYESTGQGGTPVSVFIQRGGPTMPVVE